MWPWVTGAVDAIKGMLGGKGTTQIGKDNVAISATVGDSAGNVLVAREVHYHGTHEVPKADPYVPSDLEMQILRRLLEFQHGYLNLAKSDLGYDVLIGAVQMNPEGDAELSSDLFDAVQRLLKHGLLQDRDHNGQVYYLAGAGRRLARQSASQVTPDDKPAYAKIEAMMPELFREMKEDFASSPLIREMILLDATGNIYNGGGVFMYHRDKHTDLDSMFQILENHGLVQNITWNSVDRYRVTEPFAHYLAGR